MLKKILIVLFVILLSVSAGSVSWYQTVDTSLSEREQEADRRLETAISHVEGYFGQYRRLPRMIADNENIKQLVASSDASIIPQTDIMLERLADISGASDIYVLNADGLTLSASNWAADNTFKGQHFNYRPYFKRAMQGGLGVYYALGTMSQKRGFYFSSPVIVDQTIVGVVALKVVLEAIEASWVTDKETLLFTDSDGIVFISNRKDLLFHSLHPISKTRLAEIAKGKRYSENLITALKPLKREQIAGRSLYIADEKTNIWQSALSGSERLLFRTKTAPRIDLNAHIFLTAGPALEEAWVTAGFIAALCFALSVLILLIAQYRSNLTNRIIAETRANERLEQTVTRRTEELTRANMLLTNEVMERKAAEQSLRNTQDDLVQAGKLSALGQMSAGISHELNQPLAAIRSFADNARIYLERGNPEKTSANLSQISDLTARMARIIRNLRVFARKEVDAPVTVPLELAINDALALLDTRIRDEDVTIRWQSPPASVPVKAGAVRLTQVIINILSNALDSMKRQSDKEVTISLEMTDRIRLMISDSGPGIAKDALDKIFDPFFTTKSESAGEGLGLGLSISKGIIEGFGGTITAGNDPDGGARFMVELITADNEAAA